MPGSDESNISLFTGINIGICAVGILFYTIRLTGPFKTLRSSVYLITIISFLFTSIFSYMQTVCSDIQCKINYLIAETVSTQFAAGYFVILILNTYRILDKNWLYFLFSIPLPAILSVEVWLIVYFLKYYGISTSVNVPLLTIFCTSLTSLTDFIVNMVCYCKFSNYKDITGLRTLLNQFLTGTIFSICLDISMIAVSYNLDFGEFTITQMTLISALINLNIEYFLMYQCRIIILSQIQTYNS
ncbi:hypothetical protein CONCODRAFT_9906 [Conidiobolus coronatus NRRL 28638]|uniref:Uncharacterized protein n=1 Tax=Conidiobolus coronatus (strain ATCC 28846 / CBS 209.66 / NRRL 28638) TaxID=796925 RepID=A0A137NYJ9_CONC2|nr:hypothetical protein CONCODRAFT_9906 [Conidiobolus coronatus NRRL 28638]|eukprot:KXN67940.1 hypothetical protein CONCODRAFT_9906 [Conidiobolus coronatus NRRL 28638]